MMNRNKKIIGLVCVLFMALSIIAYGRAKEDEAAGNQQESTQKIENTDSEMTSEELLDLFINGSIDAVDSTDLTSMFNIT